MGYTNHWQRPSELAADRFASAVADCQAVLQAAEVEIAGFEGVGSPLFAPDHIVFNGKAPHCCEPFEIARIEFDRRGQDVVWSFCKTEKLPYDLCVKIVLIILSHHLGEQIAVSSDGDSEDWAKAKSIVQAELNYGGDFNPRFE